MAIVHDASSPTSDGVAGDDGFGNWTGTSQSFSPPANSWIYCSLALVGVSSVGTPTNIGTALTWTLVKNGGTTQAVYVYRAFNANAQTNITVSSSGSDGNFSSVGANIGSIFIDVWTGANSSQTGAAAALTSTTTVTSNPSVTTTARGSQVSSIGAGNGSTFYSSTDTILNDGGASPGLNGARVYKAANSGGAGSVSVNFGNGNTVENDFIVYEILAPGGAAAPFLNEPSSTLSSHPRRDLGQTLTSNDQNTTPFTGGLKPINNNGLMLVMQAHGPSICRFLNADTSRGTPKTLFNDALLGQKTYQHDASLPLHPSHQLTLNQDTSRGTPKPLFVDALAYKPDYQHTAPDRVRPVTDTTRGSPLALISPPLPPGKAVDNQTAFYPTKFWWQPADTSGSTPKGLFADAFLPTFDYQHTAPDRVRPVTDTTTFAPKSLYGDVNIAFTPAPHIAPVRFFWQPADTSQGSSQAVIAPSAPFTPAPHYPPPRYWWQPADSSQGTPKVLYADALVPVFDSPQFQLDPIRPVYDTSRGSPIEEIQPPGANPPHFVPLRFWWQPADTSQSVPKSLYADAIAAIIPAPAYQVDWLRLVTDTSQSSSVALTSAVAPFVTLPQPAPPRFWWQPADTSQATPKVAYSDAFLPTQDYQHTAPDRVRPVTDTTTFIAKSLYGDVQIAFIPAPHLAPQRFWWQPADTSLSVPQALSLVAPPFAAVLPSLLDSIRPVTDTSQSSPIALIGGTPFSNFQQPAPQRFWWQPLDTSGAMPKVLFGDAARAFIPPPHFAPLKFWWQPADTSQATPKVSYTDAFAPSFNPPQYLVDPLRPVTDTSRGSPTDLLPAPFIPILHAAPARALWQPADTSCSTSKTLFGDAFSALYNVPQYQLDRIRPVVDTSQGSPYELLFFVGRPSVPPPHWAPYRFWWQPLDTCQSTSFVTSFVPPVYTRGNTVRPGIWN